MYKRQIRSFEGEVLGVQLPDKVTLQITEAEQAVKGDTATGATKNAVLDTGFPIKVPLDVYKRQTVLFSTHILSDVERICTDVAFLNNGKIAMQGLSLIHL